MSYKIQFFAGSDTTPGGGHAVVLIRCDSKCLTFMNSWGTGWGDNGFFRIKDQSVLNDMKFYDVYWTLKDLKASEKQAYKEQGAERGRELLQTFPSLQDLFYKCPKCSDTSEVVQYSGNLIEAKCPKCHQKFKPTNRDILYSLYYRNMK